MTNPIKVTHTVLATGHYVNIDYNTSNLSVLTTNGTAEELLEIAAGLRTKAERELRRAALIEAAAKHC